MFVHDTVGTVGVYYETRRGSSWFLTEKGWRTPSILSDRVFIPLIDYGVDAEQSLLKALIDLARTTLNTEVLTPSDVQGLTHPLTYSWVITSEQYPFPATGSEGTVLSQHIPPGSALVFLREVQEDIGALPMIAGHDYNGFGLLLISLPFYIEGPKTQWRHLLDTGAAE